MKHNWLLLVAVFFLNVAIIMALSGALKFALVICGAVGFSLMLWGAENFDDLCPEKSDHRHNG